MIEDPIQKAQVCNTILCTLLEWFGIEEATAGYVHESKAMVFWAAFDGDQPVGFAALKVHNAYTGEIYVMGVLRAYQHLGIGRQLIGHCEEYLRASKREFLTVKTLDESRIDEGYEKTRLFYYAMGFRPLEVFPSLWDESNPCLFMAKHIARSILTAYLLCQWAQIC